MSLVLHRGARYVERTELNAIPAPDPTPTWFPLKHGQVLDSVEQSLTSSGYQVQSMRLGLARDNHQFFGVLDLSHRLADGVSLAVGVRNSTNKTFPLGFCAGGRVFVCDNLSFRSELLVKRKHTRYGRQAFTTAIAEAITRLTTWKEEESKRLLRFQATQIPDLDAEALMLRSFEQGIVPARLLPTAIAEWRNPTYQDFRPRTLFSLENAFTTALAPVLQLNPARYAALTMRLSTLLSTATLYPDGNAPTFASAA